MLMLERPRLLLEVSSRDPGDLGEAALERRGEGGRHRDRIGPRQISPGPWIRSRIPPGASEAIGRGRKSSRFRSGRSPSARRGGWPPAAE